MRAAYLQDWLMDPLAPLTWRLQKDAVESGALGDIGADAVGMAQFITGQHLTTVSGALHTFVPRRPVLPAPCPSGNAGDEFANVSVNDLALSPVASPGSGGFVRSHPLQHGPEERPPARGAGQQRRHCLWPGRTELPSSTTPAPTTPKVFTRILLTEPDQPYVSACGPPGICWVMTRISSKPSPPTPTPTPAHTIFHRRVPGAEGVRRCRSQCPVRQRADAYFRFPIHNAQE